MKNAAWTIIKAGYSKQMNDWYEVMTNGKSVGALFGEFEEFEEFQTIEEAIRQGIRYGYKF